MGNGRPLVVIGAAMSVRRGRFISLGDTTTHGLVLLISWPFVGSSETSQTSNRLATISILCAPTMSLFGRRDRAIGLRLAPPFLRRLFPIRPGHCGQGERQGLLVNFSIQVPH